MSFHAYLGIVSGVLACVASIPYISSLLNHKTEPHPVTWVIWAITGFVAFVTYWGVGAHQTLWLAFINFLSSFVIAILSIKYWKAGLSLFDYFCLFLSVISIAVWFMLDNPAAALSLSLAADLIASLPTIRKVYQRPESENTAAWLILTIATLLSILAIDEWAYGVVVLPTYLFFLSLGITLLSLHAKKRVTRHHHHLAHHIRRKK